MTVFFFCLICLFFGYFTVLLKFSGLLGSWCALRFSLESAALDPFTPVSPLSRPRASHSPRELFRVLRCLPFMLEAFSTYLVILSCLITFEYEVPKKYLGLTGARWHVLEAFGEGGPSWQYLLAFPGGYSTGQRWILFAVNSFFIFWVWFPGAWSLSSLKSSPWVEGCPVTWLFSSRWDELQVTIMGLYL